MAKIDRLTMFTGIAGLGLLLVGGTLAIRQRRGLSGPGLGRGKIRQPPTINTYASNGMRTTLRSSPNMPIEERVASLQDLVHRSVQDPNMRKLALQITSACGERDKVCEARSIYNYVKSRVRYTGDVGNIAHPDGSIEGIDLYQSAARTLEFGGGDCDDNAVLNATLLALNGIDPVFRIVKSRGAPDWEHIYAMANINGKAYALDTTVPDSNFFGKEPPYSKRVDFAA